MTASLIRHRPIYGGVFGHGRYELATMPCVARGLHAVRFMVIEPSVGAVVSIADEKLEALAVARDVLRASQDLVRRRYEASCGLRTRSRRGLCDLRDSGLSRSGAGRCSRSRPDAATTALEC